MARQEGLVSSRSRSVKPSRETVHRTVSWNRSSPNKTDALNGTPGGTRTPDLLLRRQLLYPAELLARIDGAGDGNRTRVSSLEGWCSAIELHPQRFISRPIQPVNSSTDFLRCQGQTRSFSRFSPGQSAKAFSAGLGMTVEVSLRKEQKEDKLVFVAHAL